MSRPPRVEIEPKMYKALQAEALMMDMSPKDLVAKWIMDNLSPRALEFMGEKSKPSAVPGKIFENKSALEDLAPMPAPRARHGGKPPLEETHPQLAQEILLYYGEGKRMGGHSRSETAKHFGVGEGQIDKLVRRKREI